MIYVAELFMTGAQHAAFNGAMLQVLAQAFPSQQITLFASDTHYIQIRAKENDIPTMLYTSIHVVPNKSGNKVQWFIKFINEFFQLIRVLRKARKASVHMVYFTFLSPFAQYVVSVYVRYFGSKKQQFLIGLHGLDILQPEHATKRIDRLYAKVMKSSFRLSATNKRYVVLEERISRYLTRKAYLSAPEIIQISHPYTFQPSKPKGLEMPLVFAHLGVARLSKHSQLFFELAKRFAAEVKAGQVLFRVIGPVLPELKPHLNPFVQYNHQDDFLSHEAYRQHCLEAHYAVFFYDQSNYALTSSGAVMDAISYRLPILAIHNPVFDELVSSRGTFPGNLYEDVDALYYAIEKLIGEHPAIYQEFNEAFVALQQQYSIAHVSQQLSAQVNI